MKTKFTFLLSIALITWLAGLSQEDKKPVAENDFAECRIHQTIEILVTENDFAYDGHAFKVLQVLGSPYGTIQKTDSSIFYTPIITYPQRSGFDSMLYTIIDLENNLISDFARVYIEITNNGFEMLDINEVSCRINAYGLQFWDGNFNMNLNYEVPAGSGVSSIFNQTLWIGGIDETGDLCLSAERYRMGTGYGPDFYSGPVMDSSAYGNDQDIQWHKVWKLSAADIRNHRQHWQDLNYEPIREIMEWPGNGDTTLGQAANLAPFYDFDRNGKYDPYQGDFPLIKGDQAIFTITNDDRGPHLETGGKKLGIEIQTLYYAYENNDDSALKYTTFADQHIINRSNYSFHDVYVGHFLDFDLGYPYDDFLHCDTILQSAICYNGVAVDGPGSGAVYGEHPPAQSFTCLNYQMDGFVYFFNFGVPQSMQDPYNDFQYYRYLQGLWRDSTHFTYGGNGYGGEQPVHHVFTGDPVTGTGWTEQDSPIGPGDRRGLISSGPMNLNPGDTIHREFALVYARDFQGNNLSSGDLLKYRIQQIHSFYQESLRVNEIIRNSPQLKTYPNPCNTELFVDMSTSRLAESLIITIYDISGKEVLQDIFTTGKISKINVTNLKHGLYLLKAVNKEGTSSIHFIKGM